MTLFYCMSSLTPKTTEGNKFQLCMECGGITVHLFVDGAHHCVRHDPIAQKSIEEYRKKHPTSEYQELDKRRAKSVEKYNKEKKI